MKKMIEINELISELRSLYGTKVNSADVRAYCIMNDLSYQTITKKIENYKESRGRWNLDISENTVEQMEKIYNSSSAKENASIHVLQNEECYIPERDNTFVKFGNFVDIKKIIESGIFYPTFITGLSGNGKTFSVEQACAILKRQLVRVNATVETDEDDLIGGFRLINGETVWHNGPVIKALTSGAILLLDEIDLASNKILCLQSILEGKGIFIKKIGQYVHPAPGFNIIATANTKGKGSDDGRFIGTNVLNEAFLERFAITLEQDYPNVSVETRILKSVARSIDLDNCDLFCENLANWGDLIRKTFYEGAVDEIVSTRRLVHIIKAFKIFGDKKKSIQVCLNRFDDETKDSFTQFYDKIDSDNSEKIPEINSESKPELIVEYIDPNSGVVSTSNSMPSSTITASSGYSYLTGNGNAWTAVPARAYSSSEPISKVILDSVKSDGTESLVKKMVNQLDSELYRNLVVTGWMGDNQNLIATGGIGD
jgi:hypothetical protein